MGRTSQEQGGGAPDIATIIDRVLSVNDRSQPSLTHSVSETQILALIGMCRRVFMKQPCMLEIEPPLQVCGDIHGQYTDLLRIFSRIGWPPDKSYLFLGDYVDRGKQQLETIILIACYKCKYPETFFALRGNHECSSINQVYGFFDEVKRRYSVRLWNSFQDMFNVMPLSAVIGGRIFCMHGGLSPDIAGWNDVRNIERPVDVIESGIAADLLWSDPNPSESASGWDQNSRGISFTFGADVVVRFCEEMDIDLVARGHQVVQDGFEFFANRRLVTIFSAPRYCGEFDNNAATMTVQKSMEVSFQVLKPKGELRVRVPGSGGKNLAQTMFVKSSGGRR